MTVAEGSAVWGSLEVTMKRNELDILIGLVIGAWIGLYLLK